MLTSFKTFETSTDFKCKKICTISESNNYFEAGSKSKTILTVNLNPFSKKRRGSIVHRGMGKFPDLLQKKSTEESSKKTINFSKNIEEFAFIFIP